MSYIEIKDANGVTIKLRGKFVGDEFVTEHCSTPTGAVGNYMSKFAMDLSDSDNEQAIKDYSVTPAVFELNPEADCSCYVSRLIIYIQDSGSFDSGGYGNGSALTNGIQIVVVSDGVDVITLTNTQPIKTNTGWKKFCFDIDHNNFGSGDESLGARWTFTKAGTFIKLNSATNDKIEVRLSDDFSNLKEHTFLFQGFKEVN